jgi:hypothetical protein
MSSICVFLTDGPPDLPTTETLGTAIKNTYESYDVYHSSRIHRPPNVNNLGKKKEDKQWNIRTSYDIFSRGFHFRHWLAILKCPLPVRQGSPRDGVLDAPLFSRQHFPWQKPRYIYTDLAMQIFIIYKTVVQEVRYWRSVAKERRTQGIDGCDICADEEAIGDGICDVCDFELSETYEEQWFYNAPLGIRPIDYKPINPEIEGDGYERLRIQDHEARDMNAEFERSVGFYEDLDEEFEDLGQLLFIGNCKGLFPPGSARDLLRRHLRRQNDPVWQICKNHVFYLSMCDFTVIISRYEARTKSVDTAPLFFIILLDAFCHSVNALR